MREERGNHVHCRRPLKWLRFLLFAAVISNGFGAYAFSLSMADRGAVVVAGATGYIGKSTVRESVRQGYQTIALVRNINKVNSEEGRKLYGEFFEGAKLVQCDVSDPRQLEKALEHIKNECGSIESVVSCLASRSGIKKEAFQIDYQATLNCMEAGIKCDAGHFVLLSAICVRKPLLQFQLAKLKFEAALQAQSSMTWSIVRPTAFFKSVSGQMERLQEGKPFLMFQDSTRCNPIAESDLATYLIDCVWDKSRHNKIINLGGPDKAMTKIEQGQMLFNAVGKEPKYSRLPVWIFDVSIDVLQWLADVFKSEQLENAAELGRIGKYYAVEDMVTEIPEEMYGTITLQEHFNRIANEGQEYDPYVTMSGILSLIGDKDQSVTPKQSITSSSVSTNSTVAQVTV
mmetsp:Transcript_113092/g.326755  ORF Transcript_113092/g.326755 Transcript_113092/m.326755 type:complete len:401 (+) Transcript_113092:96-1298(+)|eukprot:CAMPEP_0176025868 /NCGR_PEP_ID=MMETSP0120_2-20121206/12663_1 /TAXON_ID=160619 /ORGANISM="Kryptoperidinium foliaceum, Strain CCMP 1326" /LENGTH=400 /DNA_ID=CAMNT_0017359059 /DNA_START=77 /DNA_END=1279 /DNA_ORIENTATION=-